MDERFEAALLSKYESLSEPKYWFVQSAVKADPYRAVREALISAGFGIEDVTDLNNDVSFVYVLDSQGPPPTLTLRLSMVGPFAVLLASATSGAPLSRVVAEGSDARSEREVALLKICEACGIEVLSRALLEEPVKMTLFDTDEGNVRLYQALFEDVDVLPWRA